ncbi:hypothetical protein DL764_002121 [Monosporascus ibericus]|uniref:Uncharacterized protein n=1 Tax=Monosporascus ibericus TaxID=155417 RepID=A0A4Q4TLR5_9PEZI|nr:hypothetical protein DL764_002121 [Monosporascus ibericus]
MTPTPPSHRHYNTYSGEMARTLVSSGSEFESAIGYSRAVISGDWVFVSGCTGWASHWYDYATNTISGDDVVSQAEQCMRNVAAALAEAGSAVDEVVRVRYILPDRRDFPRIWPVLRRWFGDSRPAATMMQAGLMNEEMRIEVEVTARKGSAVGKRDEDRGEANDTNVNLVREL